MKPLMADIFSRAIEDKGIHFDLIAADGGRPVAEDDDAQHSPEENAYGKQKRKPRKRKEK